MRQKLIALYVAVSLSVAFYYIQKPWCLGDAYNCAYSPWYFASDLNGVHSARFKMNEPNCALRFGAYWPTALLLKIFKPPVSEICEIGQSETNLISNFYSDSTNQMYNTYCLTQSGFSRPSITMRWAGDGYASLFAAYQTFWFLATMILIVCFVQKPIFPMLGVMAGLIFLMTVRTNGPRIDEIERFAYDYIPMFCWTLALFLWSRAKAWWIVPLIVLGSTAKETVAVAAFLFFFSNEYPREQFKKFIATFFGCLFLHLWISEAVFGKLLIGPPEHAAINTPIHNFLHLAAWELQYHPHLNWFGFIGGGLFATFFFMGFRRRWEWGIFCCLTIFTLGHLLEQIGNGLNMGEREFAEIVPMLVMFFWWREHPKELERTKLL